MPEVLELSENIKHYIVNGYCFENEDEYRKALKEKEGIKYLNSKIVFDDINKATRLYEDLIDKDVFTTQIGIEYMRKLRTLIIKKGGSNDIPYAVIKTVPDNVPAGEPDRQKKYKEPKVPFKDKFRTSLIINIVLVIVVAIMFAIALSSSNPNIINYERVLQDKYAGWAQELSSREEALRMQENQNSQN